MIYASKIMDVFKLHYCGFCDLVTLCNIDLKKA